MRKTAATLIGACLVAVSAFAGPLLDIPGNTFDFGMVPQNCTITQYFWFKSVGSDTLRIEDLKTGCTCATMPLEKKWIAPGDSMLVGLSWKIERNLGGIGRYPYIMTNARKEPYRISLTAIATTRPDSAYPISTNPHVLLFAQSPSKTIDSIPYTITNRSEEEMSVRLTSHTPEQVELNLPEKIGPQTTFTGFVKVKPEFASTEFSESITLLLAGRNESRVTIPIARKVYGQGGK